MGRRVSSTLKRMAKAISPRFESALRRAIANGKRRLPFRHFDRHSGIALEVLDGFQVALRKGTADEEVIKESFDHDIFFPSVPEYKPKEDDVIIDVGAHIGTFSLLASLKVPRGMVHAIEASEDSFNMLRINIAMNGRSNVVAHHLAISGDDGPCVLYHDTGNWGHSIAAKLSRSSEVVEGCTLFTFLERNAIKRCHLLKMNCEGAEFSILLSTPSSVLRRFDTLLILYHCDLWPLNTKQDLISHLRVSGFIAVIKNESEDRGWIVATRN